MIAEIFDSGNLARRGIGRFPYVKISLKPETPAETAILRMAYSGKRYVYIWSDGTAQIMVTLHSLWSSTPCCEHLISLDDDCDLCERIICRECGLDERDEECSCRDVEKAWLDQQIDEYMEATR